MRKLLLSCLLLLTLAAPGQKNLTGSYRGSSYTYIYRINAKEAREFYGLEKFKLPEKWLHTKLDSFRTVAPGLQPGNYLFIKAVENRLVAEPHATGDVAYKIINNDRDLIVALHDRYGTLYRDATVTINGKKLAYDKSTRTYRSNKYKKSGTLMATVNNVVYAFPLEQSRKQQTSFFRRLWMSVKQIFAKNNNRRQYNNFHYGTEHEQKFQGFLVCNKPKFKPGDTVRLKAFVTTKNGTPVQQPLLLRLSDRYLDVDSILTTLRPYRPGGYDYELVLSDSLDLDLDQSYTLTLEDEKSRRYDLADYDGDLDDEEYAAKRKVLLRSSFYYEEYELNSISFSARTDKKLHGRGEEAAIYLKARDANEMAVMDGRVQVTVLPLQYGEKTFSQRAVFIPDTLWYHEQTLEAVGETKIILPDSIFPRADFGYEVQCSFLNSDNERHIQMLNQTFRDKPERFSFDLRGDSLHMKYLVKGSSQPAAATLYSFTGKEDTLEKLAVLLPVSLRVAPFVSAYQLVMPGINARYEVKTSRLVTAQATRTRDSLFIRLINPAQLPVWYTVFSGNKVLFRGLGDTLLYDGRAPKRGNYFLSLQYIFNNKVHNEEYTIPYHDKRLSVQLVQPEAVYPGQTATVSLLVQDAEGKPVPGADVTAWAYTRRFTNSRVPALPYFGKLYPGRSQYARFREAEDEDDFSIGIKLAWERWSREMGLDTAEYYQFLRPQTVYTNAEPAPGGLTQLAPFVVKDGEVLPVHQLYIDEKPVFFSASEDLQRYSFAVSPGMHRLRLRTHNSTITIDSVEVKNGTKTIISILADAANPRIRLQKMKPTLTEYEKGLWSRYMILLQNNFKENHAYINSGARLFRLPQRNGNAHWVGPLPNTPAQLVVKNRFAQPFEVEGGYHYWISKGLVKQKQLPAGSSFPSYLSPVARRVNFHEQVMTEKEVDSLWQEYLYHRSASVELFTNPNLSKDGNGALQIELPKDSSSGETIFIRHILLFRHNDPDYLRLYPGLHRNLGYVQPGRYRLLFLLREDAYFIADSIEVKKDGLNLYRIIPAAIKPRDSMSIRISGIVNEKETGYYSYYDPAFNTIKESFNDKYFDDAQLTETVSGIIRNEKGQPLAGVTVRLKGSRMVTVTNYAGEYSLRTTPDGTLVVSGFGFVSREVKVKDAAAADVQLAVANHSLAEVVVTGYSATRRMNLAGSVRGLTDGYLAGSAAGIVIRGATTVSGNVTPLLIVDGVPFSGKLEDLDPASIANMNVLKGDVATSIYGSMAAGGAIIISSKTGQSNLPAASGEEGLPLFSLRRNFSDYAYWQPRLRTDAEGKASFNVTYPDDITAWRSLAMVMTGNKQSGFAESTVRSFKAISGNMALPQFAIAGDSIHAIGKALNYSMDTIDATRMFSVNDQLVSQKVLRFRNAWIDTFAVATPVADSLKLKYTIEKSGGYFDGEERSIPVFRPGVLQTDGLFAALRRDTSFTVAPWSDSGTIKIYAEASVLPALQQEVESLRNYEYLCNEQIASKIKGLLVQKRIDSVLRRPFRWDKLVRELVGKLSQNKSSQGLWAWWKEGSPALWISLHAMEAIVQANVQGYPITINKPALIDYLVFNMESYQGTERLSALHLLHLLGAKADFEGYTDSLQKNLSKMSLYEKLKLAALRQETGLPFTIDSLLVKQSPTMFGNVYWGEEGYRFFDNSIQNTLLMYRILRQKGGHEDLLEKARGYLLEKRRTGYWRNTYESSLILETILPDVLVNDSLPKNPVLHLGGALDQTVREYPFSAEIGAGVPLAVRKEGGLPLYFTAYQQHWNEKPEKVNGDFSVHTTFEKGGTTITRLKAGEPVVMKIAVSVRADASYVLVEVPIPAGCSYKDKTQGYSHNEVHREYFKNKVSLFCSSLKKGDYTFTVSLLPRYNGRYTLNPARAEMMYFPVFYGREGIKKVNID